jgi:uncharacterized protein with HEPN domain
MRDDPSRLLDILLACRHIQEAVKGVSESQFVADRKTHAVACLELEIIGEAARTISEEFKKSHPEVPWAGMVGLRHRLVHEYFRLDLAVIWEAVQLDVPTLVRLIEPLVPPKKPGDK